MNRSVKTPRTNAFRTQVCPDVTRSRYTMKRPHVPCTLVRQLTFSPDSPDSPFLVNTPPARVSQCPLSPPPLNRQTHVSIDPLGPLSLSRETQVSVDSLGPLSLSRETQVSVDSLEPPLLTRETHVSVDPLEPLPLVREPRVFDTDQYVARRLRFE